MTQESLFRLLLTIIFIASAVIGGYFRRKAQVAGGPVSHKEEGVLVFTLLRLFGFTAWLSIITYLINPHWMAWSTLPLPTWLRWVGVGLGIMVPPLFYWLFSSIGNNITTTVVTREKHSLVTHGPYRWVRHPLYAVGMIAFGAFSLTAANWFIFLMSLLALGMLLIRLPNEEARLIERFGDDYRAYIQRTGKLLPRLRS